MHALTRARTHARSHARVRRRGIRSRADQFCSDSVCPRPPVRRARVSVLSLVLSLVRVRPLFSYSIRFSNHRVSVIKFFFFFDGTFYAVCDTA